MCDDLITFIIFYCASQLRAMSVTTICQNHPPKPMFWSVMETYVIGMQRYVRLCPSAPPAPDDALHVMHGQCRLVCNFATDCDWKMSPSHWERYHAEKKPIWLSGPDFETSHTSRMKHGRESFRHGVATHNWFVHYIWDIYGGFGHNGKIIQRTLPSHTQPSRSKLTVWASFRNLAHFGRETCAWKSHTWCYCP